MDNQQSSWASSCNWHSQVLWVKVYCTPPPRAARFVSKVLFCQSGCLNHPFATNWVIWSIWRSARPNFQGEHNAPVRPLALVTISGITPVKTGAMFLAKIFYGSLDFGEFQRKNTFFGGRWIIWSLSLFLSFCISVFLSFFLSCFLFPSIPSDCQEPKTLTKSRVNKKQFTMQLLAATGYLNLKSWENTVDELMDKL